MGREYIIVGDTDMGECLVGIGFFTQEGAESAVKRMLTNPTENDKKLIKDHSNLRVKEVNSKDCWWNYGTD